MIFNIRSIPYYQLSDDEHKRFFSFLQDANLEKTQPAHVNMWDKNWKRNSSTLPYILEYSNRFKTDGYFHVIFDGDDVIACSGAYRSSFSNDIAILGTRTWISKNYRNLQIPRELLLPTQKEWAINNNLKIIALTFNEYNKNLINAFKRIRIGESRSPKTPKHMFYNNLYEVPYPVDIQYTKQYVIYEKLDPLFEFDWNSIKLTD